MKKILLLVPVLALALVAGCSTIDKTLFKPTAFKTNDVPERVVSIPTNQLVTVFQTNTITIFKTNEVGVTVTNQVVTVTSTTNREPVVLNVTIPAHQEVVPTAWAPNDTTVAVANTVGGMTGPYGAIASTAFTALLGVLAAFKGKKYRDAAISLAQGIQTTMEALPEPEAEKMKATQKAIQDDHGTRAIVAKLIESSVESKPKV